MGIFRRVNDVNVYGAYEAAAVRYCKSGEAWVEERCRDNMARIKKPEENDVGFRRPHFSIEKSLFYGPVQVSVGNAPVNRSWFDISRHHGNF